MHNDNASSSIAATADRDRRGISRRAFVAGGAVAFASILLPSVPGHPGAFFLPFGSQTAEAATQGIASSKIVVVGRSQIGIAAVDTSYDPVRPLSGAKVTITSFFNNETVEGTTGEDGTLVLDIAALAEDESEDSAKKSKDTKKKKEYCFNGSIEVTAEGYRGVLIPRMRIRSASALSAPTRPMEEGKPYLRSLSFDGWDIQYTRATFMRSVDNVDRHVIEAEVHVPANVDVDVLIYIESADGVRELASGRVQSWGESAPRTVSANEMFLNPSSPSALPAGATLHVKLTADGVSYHQVSGLDVKDVPMTGELTGNITVTPEVSFSDEPTGTNSNICTLPESLPVPLGGSSFSIWRPAFPVKFDFSPMGYLMFGLQLGSLSLTNDTGKLDRESWKSSPKETAGEQFDRITSMYQEAIDDAAKLGSSPEGSENSGILNYDTCGQILIKGAFQMIASLSYDWEGAEWSGALSAVVGGEVSAWWTAQALLGPIPGFVTFEAAASLSAGLRFAMRTYGSNLDTLMKNAVYDTGGSNIAVTSTISIGASLGVGVAYAVSVALHGAAYISFCVAFYQALSRQKSPRFTIGAGVSISVDVQVLLFKWSGPLWKGDWPCFYDSNAPDEQSLASGEAPVLLDASGRPTIEDFVDKLTIVTNDELYAVREFDATSRVSLLSDETAPLIEPEERGEGCFAWQMPELAEGGDVALLDSSSDFSYLDASSTGGKPKANIGVSGISDDVFGGIKPSADTRIFRDVFSDTKMRVLTYGNRTVMFRLASAGYGSQARTRLVYSVMGSTTWGNPVVVEFSPAGSGFSRAELYDYDFAVAKAGDASEYIYVMLISGVRPDGDGTSFAGAYSKTVVSLIRIYDSNQGSAPLQVSSAVSWQASGVVGSSSSVYSFTMPQLVSYTDTKSTGRDTNTCLLGACLVHSAKSAEALVAGPRRSFLVTFFAEHRRDQAPVVVTKRTRFVLTGVNSIALGPLAFDAETAPYIRASRRHVNIAVSATPSDDASVAAVWGVDVIYDDAAGKFTVEHNLRVNQGGVYDVERVYSCGRDGEFYVVRRSAQAAEGTCDGRLYLASFNPTSEGSFTFTPVGPTDCVPTEFAVSGDGRYLYYLVNKEGTTGQEFDDSGNVKKAASEPCYRIMAMARIGGLFSKPFVLCELSHPLDRVVSMISNGTVSTIIGAQITDASRSRADIYDIRIPLVSCATPLSVTAEDRFVFAGESNVFNVRVRNDGNTLVSGATFNLVNAAGTVVDSVALSFDSDAIALTSAEDAQASSYDVARLSAAMAKSPLLSTGTGGLLAPGDAQTYRMEFSIPEDWKGENTVSVNLTKVKIVEPQANLLSAGIDEEDGGVEDWTDEDWQRFIEALIACMVSFEVDEEEWPDTQIEVVSQLPVDTSGLVSAELSEQGGSTDSGSTGGSGASGGSDGALAPTGDDTPFGRIIGAFMKG